MAYTQFLYQIVFSTKYRKKVLIPEGRDKLFKYITGILKNKNCHLYQINGVEDHIHILTHIHQSIAVAKLVQTVKTASSSWIKENRIFPEFTNWQTKYGAFTYHIREKERLINYIKRQEEHHRKKNSVDEFKELLIEHGIEFDERYLL
jgi:putative transposase